MWSLKKRKDQIIQTEVPQEIKEYYQAERRERKGIAGLLVIATLVVTILVALVLFFGGRGVYRKLAGTNKPRATTTTSQQAAPSEQKLSDDQNGATKGAQTTPAPSQGTSSTATTTPGTTNTPSTNPALPRTGPDIDL